MATSIKTTSNRPLPLPRWVTKAHGGRKAATARMDAIRAQMLEEGQPTTRIEWHVRMQLIIEAHTLPATGMAA